MKEVLKEHPLKFFVEYLKDYVTTLPRKLEVFLTFLAENIGRLFYQEEFLKIQGSTTPMMM